MDVWGDGGLGSVWRKVGGLSVCGGWGVGKCMDEGKREGWMDVWGERIWEVYGGRVAGWMCGGWGMYGEGGGGWMNVWGEKWLGSVRGRGGWMDGDRGGGCWMDGLGVYGEREGRMGGGGRGLWKCVGEEEGLD